MNSKTVRLLWVLTIASLKARYRNTMSGLLWVIMYPVISYSVQVFAFTVIFQVKSANYPIYLLAGLIPWIFLVQSVDMCTGSYLQWGSVLKNVPIPPLVIPMIQVLDNFINYFVAYFLLVGFYFFKGDISFINILISVFPIGVFVVFTTSLCVSFAIINVKFRDLKFILTFVFSLLFYLTPIFYSSQILPTHVKFYIEMSPFYWMVRPFQELFLYGASQVFYNYMYYAIATSLISLVMMIFIWKKFKSNVVFYG
jgi:lipopolysaccharide transport system permease protein